MNTKDFPTYAPIVLRLGLTFIFVWFGVSQIMNAAAWTGLVPGWATGLSGMSALTLVHLNGVLEVVAGILLAFGIYTRYVSTILSIHLLVIVSGLGFSAIGVRDIGLAIAAFSLALYGPDRWSIRMPGDQLGS